MKRILFSVIPILIVVSLGFAVFGVMQVRFVEDRLLDEVKRKARLVAESMEMSVQHVLAVGNMKAAARIAEKFEARQRLQGCVIYDSEGQIVAITKRFEAWRDRDKPYLKEILLERKPRGSRSSLGKRPYIATSCRLRTMAGALVGMVEVIYDTSFVFSKLTELWKRTTIVLVSLMTLTFLIAPAHSVAAVRSPHRPPHRVGSSIFKKERRMRSSRQGVGRSWQTRERGGAGRPEPQDRTKIHHGRGPGQSAGGRVVDGGPAQGPSEGEARGKQPVRGV
jgi:hypothetical protein